MTLGSWVVLVLHVCVCVYYVHVDLDAFIMSGFANIDIHASEDINKNSGHPTTAVEAQLTVRGQCYSSGRL